MEPLSLYRSVQENQVFDPDAYNASQLAIENSVNKLTQSETAGDSGAHHIKSAGISGLLSGAASTVYNLLSALKIYIDDRITYVMGQLQGVVLDQIPDGTVTVAKLSSGAQLALQQITDPDTSKVYRAVIKNGVPGLEEVV